MIFDAEKYILHPVFIHDTAQNILTKAKDQAKFDKSRKLLYLVFVIFDCYIDKNLLLKERL